MVIHFIWNYARVVLEGHTPVNLPGDFSSRLLRLGSESVNMATYVLSSLATVFIPLRKVRRLECLESIREVG